MIVEKSHAGKNKRIHSPKRALVIVIASLSFLIILILGSILIGDDKIAVQLMEKNKSPSLTHPFGTDWLGRDMLARTLKGLAISFGVGIIAASTSTVIAILLSFLASINKALDYFITWLIDVFLSIPHIVTLLLISFAFGGGFIGIVVGLALTHWPSLTRLLRAEIMQVKNTPYVKVSESLGKSVWWISLHHYLPIIAPQILVGFVLLFPHAILHEAAITFLGFGLSPEQPAIGIILSESMKYLAIGHWWLAFFPGLSLLILVGIFDLLGTNMRKILDPFHGQRI